MKYYFSFVVIFLSFLLFTLFTGCSSESGVTAPQEQGKTTSLEKTTVLPTNTINLTTDTMLVLPKSGKTIFVSKKLSAAIISKLDTFMKSHPNGVFQPDISIQPNAVCPFCPLHELIIRSFGNYQPMNGKILGVWTFNFTPQILYPLGFREIMIYNSAGRDTAIRAGFQCNNMMLAIGSLSSYQSQLTDVNTPSQWTPSGFKINRCYTDEPFDYNNSNQWSLNDFATCASYIANHYSGTLSFSDWYGAVNSYQAITSNTNAYVMCDQYKDDDLFNDYWNPFKLTYGSKNVTNWMSLQYQSDWNEYTDYSGCMGAAMKLGINELWLFEDWNDINLLNKVSYSGWVNNWLQRYEVVYDTWWANTDCTCNWDGDPLNWELQTSTVLYQAWTTYPNYY